jgi:cysteine desulfurase
VAIGESHPGPPGAGADGAPDGYLDAAATEPLHPAARAAWDTAVALHWADPTRSYSAARRARLALEAASERIADLVGCRPEEVSFTSSGTSAIHLGVTGLRLGRRRVGTHAVASAVEHSSVLHALAAGSGAADDGGGEATSVGVDRGGRVDPEAFAAALRPDTALACLQAANHEVGTIQPVADVAAACDRAGVPLLVDAAQSLGWQQPPPGWSVLAASAHKWGGPPGVGLLAVRAPARWRSPSPEDERGGGRVPGFENVPGAAAAAAALAAVRERAEFEAARLRGLTDRIRTELARSVPDVEVLGDPDRRLPGIVTFSCLFVPGDALVDELDRLGFSVSTGSSCSASTLEPSHVLVAMGALTHGNIRVSLPRGVRADVVDRFLAEVPDAVARVRARLGTTAL